MEEIGEAAYVTESVNGRIPDDFPVGVYIRNGKLISSLSVFFVSSDYIICLSEIFLVLEYNNNLHLFRTYILAVFFVKQNVSE